MITNQKTKIVKIVSDYPVIFENMVAIIHYRDINEIEKIVRNRIVRSGLKDIIVRYIEEENTLVINKVLGK